MILAIYPGSFNDFHIGHLNITEKADRIFGKENVLIAIGINPAKANSEDLKAIKDKAKTLSLKLSRPVEVYSCFLHEFFEEKENMGYNVVLVRGLRNGDDLNYESNQLSFIKDFKPDIKEVFIMCDKQYEHISSSSIRQMENFRTGSGKKYLI